MSTPLKILLIYAVWFAAIYYVQRICKRSYAGSVGIPLAYLVVMAFLHIGGLLYAIPGYTHLRVGAHWYLYNLAFTEEMVVNGAFASMLCVLGIAVGCRLARGKSPPRRASAQPMPVRPKHPAPRPLFGPPQPPARSVMPLFLLAGSAGGFVLTALHLDLPAMQAIILAGRNLAVVGVCLGLWIAFQRRDVAAMKFWASMSFVVPVAYLVGWGFFSYGFTAMSIFLALWLNLPERTNRARFYKALIVVLAVYASFTVFVGYMEVRSTLREVLWSADATLGQRAATVAQELAKVRPLNILDFDQLDWINIRLNHNMFIGKAMYMHELNPYLQENGKAILMSALAWVPRFLWPTKPVSGGNDFVEQHTGMTFNDTTAIGSGPVFELFVNFGLIGVFVGSIALGWVLRWMDAYCARQLRRRDIGRFIRGFLVSVCLVNPYSLIFFFVSSMAASWVLGTLIMSAMEVTGLQSRQRPRQSPPEQEKRIWAS